MQEFLLFFVFAVIFTVLVGVSYSILVRFSYLMLKGEKSKTNEFDILFKKSFTRENKLYDVIYDIVHFSPGKKKLKEYIADTKLYRSYSKDFYLHRIRENQEKFTLNKSTVEYLELLIELEYTMTKAKSLVFSKDEDVKGYIRNQLFDSAHLLKELNLSLTKGVPITHESVKESVYKLKEMLDEALDEYFNRFKKEVTDLKRFGLAKR